MQKKLNYITHFSTFFALTLVFQMGGFPQPITGPLVNMMLFLTVIHLGLIGGISLGVLTPLIALWRGQLPAVLAPMIPFIMTGNAMLIFVYKVITIKLKIFLKSEKGWQNNTRIAIGLIWGASMKFIVLFIGVKFIVPHIWGIPLPEKLAGMMATPQLVTALVGGMLALPVAQLLRKAGIYQNL